MMLVSEEIKCELALGGSVLGQVPEGVAPSFLLEEFSKISDELQLDGADLSVLCSTSSQYYGIEEVKGDERIC